MSHGGPRPGAGRPESPPKLKKAPFATRLPQWLVEWLREQEEPSSVLIEGALRKIHDIHPTK